MLNDAVGIEHGFMTTIHAYTGDQPTLDTMHKDLYRGRAAALSMIPTSTGAAKAVGLVLPELNGKLDGVAIRVPTPNVSMIDFKFVAKRKTDKDEINKAVKLAAANQLKGILGWTDQPNVSIDFNHDPHSLDLPLDQTKVIDGNLVRVISWYDNEWGFSNRMADTAVAMGKLGLTPRLPAWHAPCLRRRRRQAACSRSTALNGLRAASSTARPAARTLDVEDLTVRYGQALAVDGVTSPRSSPARSSPCSARRAAARPPCSARSRGFVRQAAGRVVLDGAPVDHLPANQRSIGIVFQNYALFPHMTVAENVGVRPARPR